MDLRPSVNCFANFSTTLIVVLLLWDIVSLLVVDMMIMSSGIVRRTGLARDWPYMRGMIFWRLKFCPWLFGGYCCCFYVEVLGCWECSAGSA